MLVLCSLALLGAGWDGPLVVDETNSSHRLSGYGRNRRLILEALIGPSETMNGGKRRLNVRSGFRFCCARLDAPQFKRAAPASRVWQKHPTDKMPYC
jgi:hypothetical protein